VARQLEAEITAKQAMLEGLNRDLPHAQSQERALKDSVVDLKEQIRSVLFLPCIVIHHVLTCF
jgi:hypothetical protein